MNKIQEIKKSIKEIARLSLPITVSFIAVGIMGIIDTIIVGNYQTDQLAYIGLANSIFVVLFTIPIGLLQGVLIKSSQKFGARKFSSCGKIYNEGKKYLLILSIIFTAIGVNGERILTLLGQNQDMAENGGKILNVFCWAIPFILIYVNANFFLQSIKRPQIAMYAVLIANVLNIAINPILVYGKFGFPEMGAVGSATSTLICRVFLALFMLYYIHRMKKNPKTNKRFGLDRSYDTWWNDSKNTRKIGFGVAITIMATNGSFATVSTFAGWLGQHTMAIYVIMISITTLIFMVCFSISQATSIIVANAFGRKDKQGIIIATLSGFIILVSTLAVLEIIILTFPIQIFGIFTNDTSVLIAVKGLIVLLALDVFIDSLPLVVVGALNGRSDVKIPTIFQIISFLILRIIACYLLAFTFNLGLKGLIIGMMFGGLSSLILNLSRFIYLIKRDNIKGLY